MDENKVIVSTEMKQASAKSRRDLCDHVRCDKDAVCPL